MLAINPNAQPIDKEKFKSHFVNIYKTVIKMLLNKLCLNKKITTVMFKQFLTIL